MVEKIKAEIAVNADKNEMTKAEVEAFLEEVAGIAVQIAQSTPPKERKPRAKKAADPTAETPQGD